MYRHKRRHQHVEEEQLDRWLVSYADYMTLMFALFVVLYALAIVKEEKFSVLTDSLTRIFDKPDASGTGVKGEDLLTHNTPQSEFSSYGTSLDEAKGPELVADASTLSDVTRQKLGSPLISIEEELTRAIANLLEQGVAKLQRDENWLVIELNSGLLFASGSATATSSARTLLMEIARVINPVNNYLRVRGYTDDQPINNELFASNWELSVARATSVLRLLETLGVSPYRMAIEGFGQYYPATSNNDPQGRAENRKVVIAVSRYAYQPSEPEVVEDEENEVLQQKLEQVTQDDGSIRVIALPGGGIRITTRQDNPDAVPQRKQEP
ncbi:OmpA family protein [Chromatiaceae bacterium AAb-1]|nr:OmpA family protein [Chromatiaceae bacterium AAb-1]